MQLSESFIEKTKHKIKTLFDPISDNLSKNNKEINLELFISSVLKEITNEIEHLVEVTYDNVLLYKKRRYMTKKRWYEKEISEEAGLHQEINVVAKSLFEDTLKGDTEMFRQVYGCSNPDELKELRLKELKEWVEDDSIPLCHFRYVKDKTSRQIVSALKNDIKYYFYERIFNECPRGKYNDVSTVPMSIANIPVDYTNRAKMSVSDVIDDGEEKYFLDKYQISDTKIFESRINVEILKRGMVTEVLKWLNAKDIEIFNYCLTVGLTDENFLTTRQIIVDIGDIVKNVYPGSQGAPSYKAVKESLYRMQYINTGIVDDSSLRGFTTKLFDNVEISANSSGKETARIFVNIDIITQYIQNNTISYYSDVIRNFKLSTSKIGIYAIQRERIHLATVQPEAEELVFETNYNFFRGIFLFSSKRKHEHIKTIEKMLDEIVENKIAIKYYKRKGDRFKLVFYPISEQERKDLINQTVFDTIEKNKNPYFIEG